MKTKVRDHGGTATAALGVMLNFRLDQDTVEVEANYKVKLPDQVRHRTILWATPDNKLTRSNPRQQQLPFRDVNETPAFAKAPEAPETVTA